MPYVLAVVLLSLSSGVTLLAAQVVPGSYQPTPVECREAAKSLVNRASDNARWQVLPDCGRSGGRVLAKGLRDARSETDLAYLERLYGAMANIRDPDVFHAALAVMQDEGASAQARSTAILIAVEQHDNAVGLPLNLPFAEALRSGQCRLVPFTHAGYRSTTPLPATYLAQLGRTLLDVSAAPGTPDLVKIFVNCTRPVMLGAIADAVPTSAIRLAYLCGNRFRVENHSSESVNVSWKVSGTADRADLLVPSKGENTFTTEKSGPTSLYYRGKLVGTEPNGGQACAPVSPAHDTSGCREDLERSQARLAYLKELVSSPDSDHAASRRDLGMGKMNPGKVTLVTRQQDCRKAVSALKSVRQEPGTVRQIWLYALGSQGYAVDDPGLDLGFSDKVLYFFGPKFKYKLTYSGF